MLPTARIRQRIEALKAAGQWRDPVDSTPHVGVAATARAALGPIDVRSNDYLGLAAGLVSRETACPRAGVSVRSGAGAARLISGTWPQHVELEQQLSEWLQVESCLLFSSGYAANLGVVSALAGPGETIFSDALNHASIVDGCRLSRAEVVVLPHANLGALSRALDNTQGVRWVVTESYFGMDADSPDLRGIAALCAQHQAALIVDEAHALGVFGQQGRGLCEAAGFHPQVLIGGMGKALGLHGGFAACSREIRSWLWNRARSFVYSTAPSPLLCQLALDHLRQLRGADDARSRLRQLEARFDAALRSAGLPLPPGRTGPIFPVVIGDEALTMQAAAELRRRGVRCQPIRPPTVPRGASRLRITLRADLGDADVDEVAKALVEVWRETVSYVRVSAVPDGEAALGAGQAERDEAASGKMARLRGGIGIAGSGGAGGEAGAQAVGVAGQSVETGRPAPFRWIVLGCGTGVGKTFVAEGLVRALGARGAAVAGLKPIETGLDAFASSDAATLQGASFHVKHPHRHPLYAFSDPVAPSLAARRSSVTIDLAAIATWLGEVTPKLDAPVSLVVETAGGVFSPLGADQTNFDLACALGDAVWVLVAPDRLGVLHEVASTLRAMEASGRSPDWLILSAPESPDASTGTNIEELRRQNLRPRLLSLPRGETAALEALLGPR